MKATVTAGRKERKDADNDASITSEGGAHMQFLTLSDLQPVLVGDRCARRAFVRAFSPLVLSIARTVNPNREDVQVKDIAEELWCCVFEKDWHMVRLFAGRGCFPAYLKKCLAMRAISLCRRYNSAFHHTDEYRDMKYSAYGVVTAGLVEQQHAGGICTAPSRTLEATLGDPEDTTARELAEQRSDEALVKVMHETIADLPPADALLVRLLVIDRLPAEKVRDAFNLGSVTTVYTRKLRIIGKLRRAFSMRHAQACAV